MSNPLSMSVEFERKKNTQASIITAAITGSLMLLFLWMKLTVPHEVPPPAEEYIEVNIGSGDMGSGTDQPLLPGAPAPAQEAAYTPPQPVQTNDDAAKDVEANETAPDAAPIIKPSVTRPNATKINQETKVVKATATTAQPVVTQPVQRPKAVLGRTVGGTGNGGNGADTYRPGTGEGIAGGQGDQGRPGGDPNGKSYTGSPRSFGVRVLSIPNQTFEDDFNENAKVAMDIVVGEDGKVKSATFQPKGSTTSNSRYIDIARRSAFQLKMGSVDGGQKGTVIFNFKVRG